MSLYKALIFPILKRFDAEAVHYFAMNCLQGVLKIPLLPYIIKKMYVIKDRRLEIELFGLKFMNPIGLAAGFDKNAKWIDELSCLGFGFIEIGTVTPLAQTGNETPRLFRLPKDEAIINRMGFNNDGAHAVANALKLRQAGVIVGGNIGKNKLTPNEEALSDYLKCFQALFEVVDYFVINVSSPNTPDLRSLQDKKPLSQILNGLMAENIKKPKPKPILLKIAPDLSMGQLDDIIEIVKETGIAGVIATNTTVNREGLQTSSGDVSDMGAGGLSGKPLEKRATEVIRYLHEKGEGKFPIIGVGGIHTATDAIEKLEAGASLIQVYTGFIYEGPAITRKISKGILKWR